MAKLRRKYAIYYVIMDVDQAIVTSTILDTILSKSPVNALLEARINGTIPYEVCNIFYDGKSSSITDENKYGRSIRWYEARHNQFWVGDVLSLMIFSNGEEFPECIYA